MNIFNQKFNYFLQQSLNGHFLDKHNLEFQFQQYFKKGFGQRQIVLENDPVLYQQLYKDHQYNIFVWQQFYQKLQIADQLSTQKSIVCLNNLVSPQQHYIFPFIAVTTQAIAKMKLDGDHLQLGLSCTYEQPYIIRIKLKQQNIQGNIDPKQYEQYFQDQNLKQYSSIIYKFLQSSIFTQLTNVLIKIYNIQDIYQFQKSPNKFNTYEDYKKAWAQLEVYLQDISMPHIVQYIQAFIEDLYSDFPEVYLTIPQIVKDLLIEVYRNVTHDVYESLQHYIKSIHQYQVSQFLGDDNYNFEQTNLPFYLHYLTIHQQLDHYNHNLQILNDLNILAKFISTKNLRDLYQIRQINHLPLYIRELITSSNIVKQQFIDLLFSFTINYSFHHEIKFFNQKYFQFFFENIIKLCETKEDISYDQIMIQEHHSHFNPDEFDPISNPNEYEQETENADHF